ncbi:MAG: flagellin, partial [Cupriavidus necator]
AGAPGASAGASGAAGLPVTVVNTGTAQVVTNGLLNVIQNGPGNAAAVGSLAGTPTTVIQNTMNDQSIRSLMTIDASVNTLQAFRSQLANTALNNALLRAASMR